MTRLGRLVTTLGLLLALWPAGAAAQIKAGVVTNLQGAATAARAAAPQPVALKFKDDVFQNDRIVTQDRSIVRLLLGGRAVVTVRERSSLTITEVPGATTINLDTGKIAVAVARERMKPGEQLEVKTPNAVAAVRGTVFIVEVIRATAQGPGAPPSGGVTTHVFGFSGFVGVNFGGGFVNVGPGMFAFGIGNNPPSLGNMNPAQAQGAAGGLHLGGQNMAGGGNGAKDNANTQTFALAQVLPQLGGGAPTPPPQSPPTPPPPILPGGNNNLAADHNALNVINNNNRAGGFLNLGEVFPGAIVTPDSISNPPVSPAFGAVIANGLITDQYVGFGLLFGPARVAIFSDPPNAWGGVNGNGNVDLISPVEASLVKPGNKAIPAITSHLSVEIGFAAVGSLTLEAFNLAGVLIGSTQNGNDLGPHGRTLATLDVEGIHSFRVSGLDTWGMDQVHFGDLVDPPSVLTLSGPLFQSVDEQRSAVSAFLNITDVTLLGQSTDPLVWATGSRLTTVHQFASLINSGVSAAGSFLRLENGAEIIQTGTAEPLVSMDGGSLVAGTNGAGHLFDLVGRPGNTQLDGETGLTLGTDRPFQPGLGSPVFEASNGAVVNVAGSAYRVDTALLEATAPLINLAGGSSLTTGSHLLDLVNQAKVSIPSDAIAMINLNGSLLTVTNGSLVNVAGGSVLNVAGSLLSLANGSTLNILNGLLLNVGGGSSVNIGGSLVSFAGSGNLLSVNNSFAPTAIIGGVPVYGPAGSFQIGRNALAGLGTAGTIKINGVVLTPTNAGQVTGSLVAIQGNGAVKVGN